MALIYYVALIYHRNSSRTETSRQDLQARRRALADWVRESPTTDRNIAAYFAAI